MKKNEHSSLDIFGYLFSLSVLKMDGSKKRHFWQLEKDNEVAPPQHGHWAYSGTMRHFKAEWCEHILWEI